MELVKSFDWCQLVRVRVRMTNLSLAKSPDSRDRTELCFSKTLGSQVFWCLIFWFPYTDKLAFFMRARTQITSFLYRWFLSQGLLPMNQSVRTLATGRDSFDERF